MYRWRQSRQCGSGIAVLLQVPDAVGIPKDAATGNVSHSAGFPVCLRTEERYQTMREMAACVCFWPAEFTLCKYWLKWQSQEKVRHLIVECVGTFRTVPYELWQQKYGLFSQKGQMYCQNDLGSMWKMCSVMLASRHAGRLKHYLILIRFAKAIKKVNQVPPGSAHSSVSSCIKPENLPHCVAQIFHSVIWDLWFPQCI